MLKFGFVCGRAFSFKSLKTRLVAVFVHLLFEPSYFGEKGFLQAAQEKTDGGVAAEGGGDGAERAGRDARLIVDGENGFPIFGAEFGFESVETVEIIKARTVFSHPREEKAQPERIFERSDFGALRERRKSESRVRVAVGGEFPHCRVNHQFDRAVR